MGKNEYITIGEFYKVAKELAVQYGAKEVACIDAGRDAVKITVQFNSEYKHFDDKSFASLLKTICRKIGLGEVGFREMAAGGHGDSGPFCNNSCEFTIRVEEPIEYKASSDERVVMHQVSNFSSIVLDVIGNKELYLIIEGLRGSHPNLFRHTNGEVLIQKLAEEMGLDLKKMAGRPSVGGTNIVEVVPEQAKGAAL